jgi:hypothetical protein
MKRAFYQHKQTAEIFAFELDDATGEIIGTSGPLPLIRQHTSYLTEILYNNDDLQYELDEDAAQMWQLVPDKDIDFTYDQNEKSGYFDED